MPISASEALLLGCCVGQYVECSNDSKKASVLDFLQMRLGPFYSMTVYPSIRSCHAEDIPSDTEWDEYDFGRQGYSRSRPNCLFRESEGKLEIEGWDVSRRPFPVLFVEALGRLVGKSQVDRMSYPSDGDYARARLEFDRELGSTSHDLGFQCSWQEAITFLHVVKTLVLLYGTME